MLPQIIKCADQCKKDGSPNKKGKISKKRKISNMLKDCSMGVEILRKGFFPKRMKNFTHIQSPHIIQMHILYECSLNNNNNPKEAIHTCIRHKRMQKIHIIPRKIVIIKPNDPTPEM